VSPVQRLNSFRKNADLNGTPLTIIPYFGTDDHHSHLILPYGVAVI